MTEPGFPRSSRRGCAAAPSAGGFTLLEILLGLALLALVVSLVQGVYAGITRSRSLVQEQTERSHAAALLLHRMADELASSLTTAAGFEDSPAGIILDVDENLDSELEFTALLPVYTQDQAEQEGRGLARVGYRVERAEDGTGNLVRTDSRTRSESSGDQTAADEGDVLLRGVTRFRVRLLLEGDKWLESSSGEFGPDGGLSARAASIEVAWRNGKKEGGPERVLRTSVPIYSTLEGP